MPYRFFYLTIGNFTPTTYLFIFGQQCHVGEAAFCEADNPISKNFVRVMGHKKKGSGEQKEPSAKYSGQKKSLAGQAYEYAAKGSRFRLYAPNKLVAYATMICHLDDFAHLAVICSPEDAIKDCWTSFDGKAMERIDNVFGGPGSFSSFLESYSEEILACYETIEQVA